MTRTGARRSGACLRLAEDRPAWANKDFDLILLPTQPHGYGVDGPYVMRRRWDYFVKHLLGLEPPKEFKMQPATPPGRPTGN